MKKLTAKMLTSATVISLLVLAGCAAKDEMAMDHIQNETMKTESGMQKMGSMKDDMSHTKMEADMASEMSDKAETSMMKKADTMSNEMDASMEGKMQKQQ